MPGSRSRRFHRRPRSHEASPAAATPGGGSTSGTVPADAGLTARMIDAVDRYAVRAAARPLAVLGWLLALNLAVAAAFVGAGTLAGDRPLFFRELAPGTWFSFAQLLFIAGTAWAVHRRQPVVRRWHGDFFGLCAVVFLVFAVDEVTQATLFLGKWLSQDLGLSPASGFNDVDSVILTLGFAGTGLLLLPRALVLLRHPRALLLFGLAGLLGAASQGLDSFVAATRWEFVAEESFKMAAEAVFIGAFLVALHDTLARTGERSKREAAGLQ